MKLHNLVAVFAGFALAAAAPGAVHIWNINLTGAEEVPPVNTPATGLATVTLDDLTGAVTVDGTFQNLLAPVTVAHIHGLAGFGQTAPPILGLTVTGNTTGTVNGAGTITQPQITGMLAGLTYVNVHSSLYPNGEVRGQIVPEPAALALLGLGVMFVRRR